MMPEKEEKLVNSNENVFS